MGDARLSQITTQWSLVFEACRGPGESDRARQAELLESYCGAIYRYALKVSGGPQAADEICQEFAMRFVRGDFHRADPSRGRFRDYVKTAIFHLLGEHRRQEHSRRRIRPLPHDVAVMAPAPTLAEDEAFRLLWRNELLNRTWAEMGRQQSTSGPPYYAALRLKAEQPELSAADLAARLGSDGSGPYTSAGVRQLLHRAREVFARLLLDEVARSLMSDDPDLLADELAELDLLTYCRRELARRRG